MRKAMAVVCALLLAGSLSAEENKLYKEASDLYRYQKYEEARVKFEQALAADPKDERIYFYLGNTYRWLKRVPKAVAVLQQGLQMATKYRHVFLNELGICHDENGLGDLATAEKYYSQSIAEKDAFADPYLSRANIRLKFKVYNDAKTDYITYLKLKPDAPQRPEIERMIAQLGTDVANQQKLLDDILDSLKNASTDTRTDAAGTEEFKDTKKDEGDILD